MADGAPAGAAGSILRLRRRRGAHGDPAPTFTGAGPGAAAAVQRRRPLPPRYSQALVTAKLLATSRLSMWGVSLNSEVENCTMPTRNALYSWSAPLGNSPPAGKHTRQAEGPAGHGAGGAGGGRRHLPICMLLEWAPQISPHNTGARQTEICIIFCISRKRRASTKPQKRPFLLSFLPSSDPPRSWASGRGLRADPAQGGEAEAGHRERETPFPSRRRRSTLGPGSGNKRGAGGRVPSAAAPLRSHC